MCPNCSKNTKLFIYEDNVFKIIDCFMNESNLAFDPSSFYWKTLMESTKILIQE